MHDGGGPMKNPLLAIPEAYHRGEHLGITSVCSAHPLVIEAALRLAGSWPVLIEATCNQVNQDGGYTGMTPVAFREFVEGIAGKVGLDAGMIVLGGDHLGPNPWKGLPADEAMAKAEAMIAAYAQAGFTKLHLDTSIGCMGEPAALPDAATAERAARMAAAAERNIVAKPPLFADYQTTGGLRTLVANGFAILKVGPWLTFCLREALYALDAVADVLEGHPPKGGLMAKMEDIMIAAPGNWKEHYEGDTNDLWLKRHFSYLDRIRYYWPTPEAESAVSQLNSRLVGKRIPAPVIGQFLPHVVGTSAEEILLAAVELTLRKYQAATSG